MHKLELGARVTDEGVTFRVWAPNRKMIEVDVEGKGKLKLQKDSEGYFSGTLSSAKAGDRYRYVIENGKAYPDPASRFQPEGPDGPSEIIDSSTFSWTDEKWPGSDLARQIIYEMHIGTFTSEGIWKSAEEQLVHLAEIGITLLEIMPVADFPGEFGWGYDGVNIFAPTRLYGSPDDFRSFVDKAHNLGMGVILDVVYNHLGSDKNYIGEFSPFYFTKKYENEWGAAINFDGENSEPVREFFLSNAQLWIDEYHLDGLRLDATQQIFDDSEENIMLAIPRRVREAARGKKVLIVSENEPQNSDMVRCASEGGFESDALWNDDFHHSAVVALTGRNEAYYTDYLGTPQELLSAIKWGYLYQGQLYKWQSKRRGVPGLNLRHEAFINFIENHDQLANSGAGKRMHQLTSPGRHRAVTALFILGAGTPMLFQGQEFSASTPFLYFADCGLDLADMIGKGRAKSLSQFPSLASAEATDAFAKAHERKTFERCKLNHTERTSHPEAYALHKDLIALRRDDPVLAYQERGTFDGAVLSPSCFIIRFFNSQHGDRLLFINLATRLNLNPAPEPLLAPPKSAIWKIVWSSESVRYGGHGMPEMEDEDNWTVPAESAVLLKAISLKSIG